MDWYVVIKTIKGRRYYYRQKTWREGKHVRTLSQYIGPAGDDVLAPSAAPKMPEAVAPNLAKESLKVLLGKQANDWEHHWEAGRSGPVEVKKIAVVDVMIRSLGVRWTHNTEGAYFWRDKGEINIPPLRCFTAKNGQSATSAYYVVLFHELTHWTKMHIDRPFGRGNLYAREELVAELGAIMLMKHFELEIGAEGRHAHYFQFWLDRIEEDFCTRDEALKYAQTEAERAVQFILKRGTMRV